MKNTAFYYLAILIPFGVIIWLGNTNEVSRTVFWGLLIFYLLIYRPFTDGLRLVDKGLIMKKDIWKLLKPGNHIKYSKELYLP